MLDPLIAAAGFLVGCVVGLTGMGGGALMTPLLVLVFGVQPLAAVSSDIVASMVMKPVGGGVHWRRGTVKHELVRWLVLGSVPAAFLGVVLLRELGTGAVLQERVRIALGVALLVVSGGLLLRPLLTGRQGRDEQGGVDRSLEVRRVPTVLIGVLGGLVVGITSVGSGSLMIILLLFLYPRIRLSELVGTDLVQAIPLVTSAAIGHLLFGDFQLGLTGSILAGAIPGAFLGAHFSSRAPDHLIRPALVVVLLASGAKLLGMPSGLLVGLLVIAVAAGVVYAVRTGRLERSAPHP